jgi:phenylpropionate dioxygenase-like ring-hydroxylating dioxygenase large terminal subunit
MGEPLPAVRDTRGRVGIIDQHCPHRGANLWLGRNEGCGIPCVYHGWKFDVEGRCLDMPTSYAGNPERPIADAERPLYKGQRRHRELRAAAAQG